MMAFTNVTVSLALPSTGGYGGCLPSSSHDSAEVVDKSALTRRSSHDSKLASRIKDTESAGPIHATPRKSIP
jgi:hypothetical protein